MADLPAGKFSGGPLHDFAGGWARIPFVGRVAHHWREVRPAVAHLGAGGRVRAWESGCGVLGGTNDRVSPLGVGDMGWCKRCAAKHGAPSARDLLNALEDGTHG